MTRRRILAIAAALALLALPAAAQAPVPPAGSVILVVGWSDGTTVLPVTSGTLPLICEVAQP
jgi:ABC-type nitrate/sulfonate/bicarbonate transport system substrate-binding protein